MNNLSPLKKEMLVPNDLGIHARAATKIAQLAQHAKSNVWIIKEGQKANASSVLDILMLACYQGTEITLTIENSIDLNILEDISSLVENGFGELA